VIRGPSLVSYAVGGLGYIYSQVGSTAETTVARCFATYTFVTIAYPVTGVGLSYCVAAPGFVAPLRGCYSVAGR